MKKNHKKKVALIIIAVVIIGFVALVIHNYKTKTSFKYNNTANASAPVQNSQDPVNQAVVEDAKAQDESRKNSELLKILPEDYVLGD
ncbi:MAG: hypothetical protein ACO26G_01540, partial [Rickettsiales bacterium]